MTGLDLYLVKQARPVLLNLDNSPNYRHLTALGPLSSCIYPDTVPPLLLRLIYTHHLPSYYPRGMFKYFRPQNLLIIVREETNLEILYAGASISVGHT